MSQERLGFTELEWACPFCSNRNRGSDRFCASCGAPQPDDVAFLQPAQERLIEEGALLEQAKSAPDVHCAYCNSRNPATNQFCTQCGASLSEGVVRGAGAVIGAHRDEAAAAVTCPACGTVNDGSALRCRQCRGPLPAAASDQVRQSAKATRTRSATRTKAAMPSAQPEARPVSADSGRSRFILPLIGIVVVALIFMFIMRLVRTEELVGEVVDTEWTRLVELQALQPITYEAWIDDIPDQALDWGNCQERVRRLSDDEVAGANKICGTPYSVDLGNGFAEVVQDCQYEVVDDWCEYVVNEWVSFDTITVSGNDLNPQWPANISLADNQRVGEQGERFQVTFATDGDRYVYTPDDSSEYSQFAPGSDWILEVNGFGGVVSVAPR